MDATVWLRLLDRFGQDITLVKGEQRQSCRAFFQPVRETKPGEAPAVLGMAPEGKFLYLGPPNPDPEGMDHLEWNERRYHFIRTRAMTEENQVVYQWGIAVKDEEGLKH